MNVATLGAALQVSSLRGLSLVHKYQGDAETLGDNELKVEQKSGDYRAALNKAKGPNQDADARVLAFSL